MVEDKYKNIKIGLMITFFVFISLLFLMPIIWMILSSFKSSGELFTTGFGIELKNITLENYLDLGSIHFTRWYINSLIFAGGYIIFGVFLCSLAGFAFAKYDFKFKNTIFLIIIAAQMLPIHMQLVPLFVILARTGLINSYVGLILPMVANPFGLFFARQYMLGIPDDLLNAARIDGASEWEIYLYVVLPISKPVLAALAILFSLFAWNELIWPLVVMRTEEMFTLSVGLSTLVGGYEPRYGLLMAGSVLVIFPIITLFLLMQEHFISGLTAGSIKE